MDNDPIKAGVTRARGVAQKLLKEVGILSAPVNLKRIVEHLKTKFPLEIAALDLKDLDGIQVNADGIQGIGYNKNNHPHRQRFTIAHEIGHLLLGHTRQNHRQEIDLESGKPDETEANTFAAELLMPRQFIQADYKAGLKDVVKLASKYLVSDEAMGWQIYPMLHLLK